jgi:Holliday junction resolvase RusA-like endonuclease
MSAGPGIGVLRLSFEVPGRPVPKARARQGRAGRGGRHVFYTPQTTRGYEERVAWLAKRARTDLENRMGQRWPLDQMYSLKADIYTMRGIRIDLDNVGKLLADACEGVLWINDRLVYTFSLQRIDVPRPELERAELTITVTAPEVNRVGQD